jgi:DNA-binding XRE family transcriptional regulator
MAEATDVNVKIDPEKLKALRVKRGKTVTEMAAALRSVENTYRAMEKPDADPKLSQVLKVMRVLGLRPRDIEKLLPS